MTQPGTTEPFISVDSDGLDEFIAHNVSVHFEAMNTYAWWIGVTDPATGRSWSIRCGSASGRAKGFATIEED